MNSKNLPKLLEDLKVLANEYSENPNMENYKKCRERIAQVEPDGRKARRWNNLHSKYVEIIKEFGSPLEVVE